MSQCKILVVEDDHTVRNLITTTLHIHDYLYVIAKNGKEAISHTASMSPDIILMDLGLPDIDGIDVIRQIRTWSKVPILVISARTEDSDKIEALDAGADDYLIKPFSVDELLARLRATQRRLSYFEHMEERSPIFTNGKLKVNYASDEVSVDGKLIHLTPIEFKLLKLLADNLDRVLTHSFIIREIWGIDNDSNRTGLRVYMASLRKKLVAAGAADLIQTRVGIGYRMTRE